MQLSIALRWAAVLLISCCLNLSAVEETVHALRSGPDEQRVMRVRTLLNPSGDWITETNTYTELATGISYWDDATQRWQESVEEIEIVDSGAVALRAPHKVIFAATLDDPKGSIDYLAPNGQRMRSAILALAYFDPVTGQRVTIGLVKDVVGELIPRNQIIYRDAFESTDPEFTVSCDVVYTYRRSGLEQDVVIRQMPPPPEVVGFDSAVARFEVLTEMYEIPEPSRHPNLLASVQREDLRAQLAEPDWYDENLDFGGFIIGVGRAFRLNDERSDDIAISESVGVAKKWVRENERQVLIEAVEFVDLLPMLLDLPGAHEAAKKGGIPDHIMAGNQGSNFQDRLMASIGLKSLPTRQLASTQFPKRRAPSDSPQNRQSRVTLAKASSAPGVVIDYVALGVNSTNFTFKGDETYYVSDTANLAGTTTLEGGTIVKYAPWGGGPRPEILIHGPFVNATSLYRPAIFTARDDQSVGATIAGSAGLPNLGFHYVLHGLWFQTTNLAVNLENVRFRYGWHPVIFNGRNGLLRNSQFQYCSNPVYAYGAVNVRVENMLAAQMLWLYGAPNGAAPLKAYYGGQITAEHLTICNSTNLIDKDGSSSLTLRNSLLVAVTNIQTYTGRNDPAYGNHEASSPSSIFQSVGAGNYYLAAGSPHRNAGNPIIEPSFARTLRRLTTYPPIVISNAITSDVVLGPQAQRDTDFPDRGYHYAPLDYFVNQQIVTNCTIYLTNGAALAVGGTYGLRLQTTAKFYSIGTAAAMNRIVRYDTVQEQPFGWTEPQNKSLIQIGYGTGALPELHVSFTECALLAVEWGYSLYNRFIDCGSYSSALQPFRLFASHCQLAGAGLVCNYGTTLGTPGLSIALTNCLFDRSAAEFQEAMPPHQAMSLTAFNNTFRGVRLDLVNDNGSLLWTIRDNIIAVDAIIPPANYADASHNGFLAGLSPFGSNAKSGLLSDFVTGPGGRFYYPAQGATNSLLSLINQGSRTAAHAGLYHFTTRTDQQAEAGTQVDIGFHYPANGPSTDGLVAHWRFDEISGTQALDSSVNGFHGSLANGPVWEPNGVMSGAISFDGINDNVTISNAAALEVGKTNADFTVSYWMNLQQSFTGSWRGLLLKSAGTTNRTFSFWMRPDSDKLYYRISTVTEWNEGWESVSTIPVGSWVHVAAVKSGNKYRLYLNGILDRDKTLPSAVVSNPGPIYIGDSPSYSPCALKMDDLRIYSRALSPAELLAVMSESPKDTDGDGTPDYAEDLDGDGLLDSGETSYQSATDTGFRVRITRPQSNVP